MENDSRPCAGKLQHVPKYLMKHVGNVQNNYCGILFHYCGVRIVLVVGLYWLMILAAVSSISERKDWLKQWHRLVPRRRRSAEERWSRGPQMYRILTFGVDFVLLAEGCVEIW